MRASSWRAILLACCAAGVLLTAINVFDQLGMGGSPGWYGVTGAYISGCERPFNVAFRGIDPGGPADRAGLREGDCVDFRAEPLLVRFFLLGQPLAGLPITYVVTTAHTGTPHAFVANHYSVSRFWNYMLWELASIWMLLFAALILVRRPYVDNNLLLASVLVFSSLGLAASTLYYAWPWPAAYLVLFVLGQTQALAIALLATLASAFARPLSSARRIALALCYLSAGSLIVFGNGTPDRAPGLATVLGTLTLWFDPTRFIGRSWTLLEVATVIAAIGCVVLAIVATRGVEHRRALWVLVPTVMLFIAGTASLLSLNSLSYAGALDAGYSYSFITAVAPLVLTYAALNRRLIDVGFILNRTVVFAIISTIVIGAFILVEWAAGTWLVNESHTTSVIAGMVVALALGLSMRYIHHYVDRFVDSMLFRKRHEDETALRRFAHEAAYVNDREELVRRSLESVRNHTAAETSDMLLFDGSAAYRSVSDPATLPIHESDPAIVALRAWNKTVDLHAVPRSQVHGDLVFPMAARGRLVGALVCGPKRDGEAYAPDETDALGVLAHGVAGALELLEARDGRSSEAVMAELAESVRTLTEIARSLPDTLAERFVSKER
ncbi:MAG TPA: PDZ domain-containing protein [Candidatus Baltobacteraceae bacterium]|nr:PDZ domain-containing protein [Candidatus Baltobacteraceae bacterium]